MQPAELGELRARLQPALLLEARQDVGKFHKGDLVMVQNWGNGLLKLESPNPQLEPPELLLTSAVDGRLGFPGGEDIRRGELRAILQPLKLIQLTAPVLSTKGRMRFAAGDQVIAQFWAPGRIMLYPVKRENYPAAWVQPHVLEGRFAAVEMGPLKGEVRHEPVDHHDPGSSAEKLLHGGILEAG